MSINYLVFNIEVLSSIHETYDWYINYIKEAKGKKHDKIERASPYYLYL